MSADQLEAVKAGDKIIRYYGYGSSREVVEVKRVTATQIIVAGVSGGSERRYRKATGYEVGSSGYDRSLISFGSAAALAEIGEQRLRDASIEFLRRCDTRRISTASLAAAVVALKQAGAKDQA